MNAAQCPYLLLLLIFVVAFAAAAAVYYAINKKVAAPYQANELKINEASFKIGAITALFAVFGVLAALVSSFNSAGSAGSDVVASFGVNLLAAAAGGSLGSLLGFLFGIPRTLDPAARAAVAGVAAADGRAADKTNVMLSSNTNLERVSDWLTTLLIGATIVQIGKIGEWLQSFARFLTAADGKVQGPIVLLLLYFFVLGFLGIYLITRLYLTNALTQTLGMLGAKAEISSAATMLADALASTNPRSHAEYETLISMVENFPLSEEYRRDPKLNAKFAQLLYGYIAKGPPTDLGPLVTQLRSAVINAASSVNERRHLSAFFTDEALKQGDRSIAGDIIRDILSAPKAV